MDTLRRLGCWLVGLVVLATSSLAFPEESAQKIVQELQRNCEWLRSLPTRYGGPNGTYTAITSRMGLFVSKSEGWWKGSWWRVDVTEERIGHLSRRSVLISDGLSAWLLDSQPNIRFADVTGLDGVRELEMRTEPCGVGMYYGIGGFETALVTGTEYFQGELCDVLSQTGNQESGKLWVTQGKRSVASMDIRVDNHRVTIRNSDFRSPRPTVQIPYRSEITRDGATQIYTVDSLAIGVAISDEIFNLRRVFAAEGKKIVDAITDSELRATAQKQLNDELRKLP
ncbi:MAG: hypothetical protein V1784_05115 [bacterium]